MPFIEVYIDASVEECEKRDPKGLYKKARAGEIKGECRNLHSQLYKVSSDCIQLNDTEFTGISAPYEAPTDAEIHIDAGKTSIEESVKIITEYLLEKGIVKQST